MMIKYVVQLMRFGSVYSFAGHKITLHWGWQSWWSVYFAVTWISRLLAWLALSGIYQSTYERSSSRQNGWRLTHSFRFCENCRLKNCLDSFVLLPSISRVSMIPTNHNGVRITHHKSYATNYYSLLNPWVQIR